MTGEWICSLEVELAMTLARDGRGRLLALARWCADLVLPLYEASAPGDERLRRALRAECTQSDIEAAAEAWMSNTTRVGGPAGLAVLAVAALPFVSVEANADLVREVGRGVRAAARAVDLALATASAQERLDLLARFEGESSFDALLRRRWSTC